MKEAEFKKELKKRIKDIEDIITDYMPEKTGKQKEVMEAMDYSIMAGGKRLRPMLLVETYKLCGGKGDLYKPFAAAMEMIHTYSLVHDDLPAMDNDEYRRGKKTTHAVYGEGKAVLAGDALLNYAFETMLKAFDMCEDDMTYISNAAYAANVANADCIAGAENAVAAANAVKAMRIIAKKAGIYGMIGGQQVDIDSENKQVDLETVLFIHRLKCGALIEAAMKAGAVLAGAPADICKTIEEIGGDIGLAFQIQDDILDVIGNEEELGKPVGSDDKNEKSTYVTLKGLDEAKKEVNRLTDSAIEKYDALPYENDFLRELLLQLAGRSM